MRLREWAERDGVAYIAALNWALGTSACLLLSEERFSVGCHLGRELRRQDAPWNWNTSVRGMEFGTTPMPLGKDAVRGMGPLFDAPVARSCRRAAGMQPVCRLHGEGAERVAGD